MHFGRFPRKTILAATLLLAFSAANASFLEQTGSPPTTTVAMTTYGVDVATRVGLKAVIPSGWQLFVHRSVELPESLSWKVEESWVSVLSNFAKANDIAVLVDWDKKSVYFRSTALALQEQEKRQMIAQAAATPLPSFKDEPVQVAVAAVPTTAPAPAAAPTVVAQEAPVVAAAAPAPVAAPALAQVAASAPVAVATAQPAAPAVGSTEAKAPVVTGVVDTAKAVAEAKPIVEVKPAASLLDRVLDAAAQPAAAPKAAPAVATFEPAKAIAIEPAAKNIEVPAAVVVAAASAAPVASAAAAVLSGAAVEAIRAVAVVAAPATKAAPAPTAAYAQQDLAVEKTAAEAFNRQAVDVVVRAAAEKHGYLVSWEAADVQFPGPVTILGADMGEDMRLVLRALGGRRSPVSIDVYRGSNVVRVRNASGTAEVAFSEMPFQGALREKSASTFTVRVREEAALQPTLVAAPAPVVTRATPPVAVPVVAVAVVAPAPVVATVVPEPARLDTAVAAIKKLEPAAQPVSTGSVVAPVVAVGEVEPRVEAKPVVAAVVLRVERGEALHAAIEALLEPGWSLKWDVNGDMEANTALEVAGESLAAVLNKVLPRLALSADIYKPSKLVVIRPADAALDK